MDPSNDPNYAQISLPADKEPEAATWAERRGELWDMVEQAGHYRRLELTQRELADHYGVAQKTISRDLNRINEVRAYRLGDGAAGELDTLKTRAVLDLLEEGETANAYYLMAQHYKILMDTGAVEQAPARHEHSGPDGEAIEVSQDADLTDDDRAFLDAMFNGNGETEIDLADLQPPEQ